MSRSIATYQIEQHDYQPRLAADFSRRCLLARAKYCPATKLADSADHSNWRLTSSPTPNYKGKLKVGFELKGLLDFGSHGFFQEYSEPALIAHTTAALSRAIVLRHRKARASARFLY